MPGAPGVGSGGGGARPGRAATPNTTDRAAKNLRTTSATPFLALGPRIHSQRRQRVVTRPTCSPLDTALPLLTGVHRVLDLGRLHHEVGGLDQLGRGVPPGD